MAELKLTLDDDRRTVPVSTGDEIVLVLPENPTTGYRWHLELDDTVEQLSDAYTSGEGPEVGGGGTHEFRLRPVRRGRSRVTARLHRRWSPDDARQTCEFLLEVR